MGAAESASLRPSPPQVPRVHDILARRWGSTPVISVNSPRLKSFLHSQQPSPGGRPRTAVDPPKTVAVTHTDQVWKLTDEACIQSVLDGLLSTVFRREFDGETHTPPSKTGFRGFPILGSRGWDVELRAMDILDPHPEPVRGKAKRLDSSGEPSHQEKSRHRGEEQETSSLQQSADRLLNNCPRRNANRTVRDRLPVMPERSQVPLPAAQMSVRPEVASAVAKPTPLSPARLPQRDDAETPSAPILPQVLSFSVLQGAADMQGQHGRSVVVVAADSAPTELPVRPGLGLEAPRRFMRRPVSAAGVAFAQCITMAPPFEMLYTPVSMVIILRGASYSVNGVDSMANVKYACVS
ncbi:hypothetical protein CKAH01_17478 [Colletotrichum kahawae]|uniref:Uncharacterized protein n=1 Tax=Colletotrichum kahawae TaxID=34407 RepID=A0AAD9YBX2_COLKA|nr:hypothetical protein CKAH01_17478 [Colletotrichum kahawae]